MSKYCEYHKMNIDVKGHFPVDTPSQIPGALRDYNPNSMMPKPVPNGGLYGGPQSTKPWATIPVAPTSTNLIFNNLQSANPPPGAIQQANGTIRLGNNYTSMPETKWYNPEEKDRHGRYKIQGI